MPFQFYIELKLISSRLFRPFCGINDRLLGGSALCKTLFVINLGVFFVAVISLKLVLNFSPPQPPHVHGL